LRANHDGAPDAGATTGSTGPAQEAVRRCAPASAAGAFERRTGAPAEAGAIADDELRRGDAAGEEELRATAVVAAGGATGTEAEVDVDDEPARNAPAVTEDAGEPVSGADGWPTEVVGPDVEPAAVADVERPTGAELAEGAPPTEAEDDAGEDEPEPPAGATGDDEDDVASGAEPDEDEDDAGRPAGAGLAEVEDDAERPTGVAGDDEGVDPATTGDEGDGLRPIGWAGGATDEDEVRAPVPRGGAIVGVRAAGRPGSSDRRAPVREAAFAGRGERGVAVRAAAVCGLFAGFGAGTMLAGRSRRAMPPGAVIGPAAEWARRCTVEGRPRWSRIAPAVRSCLRLACCLRATRRSSAASPVEREDVPPRSSSRCPAQ
jgi:hypothetical protein